MTWAGLGSGLSKGVLQRGVRPQGQYPHTTASGMVQFLPKLAPVLLIMLMAYVGAVACLQNVIMRTGMLMPKLRQISKALLMEMLELGILMPKLRQILKAQMMEMLELVDKLRWQLTGQPLMLQFFSKEAKRPLATVWRRWMRVSRSSHTMPTQRVAPNGSFWKMSGPSTTTSRPRASTGPTVKRSRRRRPGELADSWRAGQPQMEFIATDMMSCL